MQATLLTSGGRSPWGTMVARLLGSLGALQRRRAARQLHVRETLAIGNKRQLHILECAGRRLLIGTSGNFIAKLADLDFPPPAERADE